MKNIRAEKPRAKLQANTQHQLSNENQALSGFSPEFASTGDIRQVMAGNQTLSPSSILRLQHTVGNQAVQRILQTHKAHAGAANTVQRAGGKAPHPTYLSEAGQSWKDIATLHGFETDSNKMQSFYMTNNITVSKLNDKPAVGTTVKLPRGTVPKTPTTTTGTTTTTGITGSTATAVTVPSTAELGTVFGAIGKFLDFMLRKKGDKYSFEFGFRVPVYGGVFVGMKLSGEAELDSSDSGGNVIKLDAKLGIEGKASYSFLYYGQVDFASSLVRNLKAESGRGGAGAMESLSFGLYRSLQENNYIPGRILNWMWGADREEWSARTAGRMAGADDKAFVGFALGVGVGGSVGGTKATEGTEAVEGWKLGIEAGGSIGTEYNKDSIEKGESNGSGGFTGTKGSSWFGGGSESSLGESKKVMEFAAKTEIMGTEVGVKLAREGTEWGMELGFSWASIANLSKVEWSEYLTSLSTKITGLTNAIGGKYPEMVKMFAQTAGIGKRALRGTAQIAELIKSIAPGKEAINSVLSPILNVGSKVGGGISKGMETLGSTGTSIMDYTYGDLSQFSPEEGTSGFNIDREGKSDFDGKLNGVIKINISKREIEFGADLVAEAGFENSAMTVKGAKSTRIFKVKKP